jgi:hypothetical protein
VCGCKSFNCLERLVVLSFKGASEILLTKPEPLMVSKTAGPSGISSWVDKGSVFDAEGDGESSGCSEESPSGEGFDSFSPIVLLIQISHVVRSFVC